MKLKNKITIQPPAYSDNSGKIITPNPLELEELKLTIIDNLFNKIVYIQIQGVPSTVPILSGQDYDNNGDWTRQQIIDIFESKLGDNPAIFLRSLFPKTLEEDPNHPGTVLSKMIKSLGIVMTDSCSCRRHALEMNAKGNDWCEQNIDVVVGWLREEAARRKLPFLDTIGKLMVSRAIKKSRKLLANEPIPDNDEDLDNV
jgi:hypothetical protein